jgi:hypothetical protein
MTTQTQSVLVDEQQLRIPSSEDEAKRRPIAHGLMPTCHQMPTEFRYISQGLITGKPAAF